MKRRRVLLTREERTQYARVVDADDLADLLDALTDYGPEPFGFAVEIAPGFESDLPPGWDVRRLDDGTGEAFAGP